MKKNTKSIIPKARGFTLIELLTVITIIGILSAILIPTVSKVREKAKKAKTRVVFQSWISAMEAFKQDYGFFPAVDKSDHTSTATRSGLLTSISFAANLTGRNLDSTPLTAADITAGKNYDNRKLKTYISFTPADFDETRTSFVDAFGNTEIGVVVDRNSDGIIRRGEDYSPGAGNAANLAAVRPGNPPAGTAFTPTDTAATDDIPPTGLRANVIFYSAGRGEDQNSMVYSWK